MTGTIGCCPGRIVNPCSVRAFRKNWVLFSKRSRNSVDRVTISIALIEAATMLGVTLFENRYGLERCRSNSTIALPPVVYPPPPPPTPFPKPPLILPTRPPPPHCSSYHR